MPILLTDAHLAILRAAADRPDTLLIPPDRLLGAARTRMATRLIALGVAERVAVAPDELRWLASEGEGAAGLRLTAAGRDDAAAALARESTPARDKAAGEADASAPRSTAHEPSRVPRSSSKAALLRDMLGRDGGASVGALGAALGWQPHTVRAALTRLRQGGASVERVAGEDGRSLYRLTLAPPRPDHGSVGSTSARDGAA